MKKAFCNHWSRGNFYYLIATLLAIFFLLDSRIGLYDWNKEIAYFNVIKTSLTRFQSLPLFWWNPEGCAGYPAVSVSSFFLGNPETFALSPFVPLLFVVDTLVFMKLLYILFLGFAILGIEKLGKRLNWQPNQQRIFTALFLFSPIIIQHIAIGYFPWLNLFLFPWFLFFLFEEKPVSSLFGTACVLSLVLLQGGLHPFVWFAIFFGIFFLVSFLQKPAIRIIFLLLGIIALTILLSCVRLSTSMQTFADFQQSFFNGYRPSGFIRWGLTPPLFTPADMDDIEPYIESYDNGVPYWDGAIYWGGVLPLVIPALIVLVDQKFKYRPKGITERQSLVFSVGISALVMTLLSFGTIYRDIIVPVSNLLSLPSLQGMEKYPFRFALLGYYGCSFIVANCYDDILLLIKKTVAVLAGFIRQLNQLILRINRNKYQRQLLLIVIVISILYTISVLMKVTFLTWFTEIARNAYDGQSYSWLAGMMSQRASIPFSAYLNKINEFYFSLQVWIFRVTIVGWLFFFLLIFNHRIRGATTHFNNFLINRIPAILEICLVIPVLFAFIMWMRVAQATPLKDRIQFDFVPPEAETIPASTITSLRFWVTPARLHIEKKTIAPLEAIVFTNIKYSDHRFLQTINSEDQWFNQDGQLGIIPAEMSDIQIWVDQRSYQPALMITIISWTIMIVVWFSYWVWLGRRSLSKIKYNTQRRKTR